MKIDFSTDEIGRVGVNIYADDTDEEHQRLRQLSLLLNEQNIYHRFRTGQKGIATVSVIAIPRQQIK